MVKLKRYASFWYEILKKNQARETKSKIKTWSKLKKHMERRFLPSSYKQELYLKITYFSQENLEVEKYIGSLNNSKWELGWLKIMSLLLPDSSRVYLLTWLKGRRLFPTPLPHQPQSIAKGFSSRNKVDPTLTPIKVFDKVKGFLVSLLRG